MSFINELKTLTVNARTEITELFFDHVKKIVESEARWAAENGYSTSSTWISYENADMKKYPIIAINTHIDWNLFEKLMNHFEGASVSISDTSSNVGIRVSLDWS